MRFLMHLPRNAGLSASPTRVSSGPFSATLVDLSEAISSSGTGEPNRRSAIALVIRRLLLGREPGKDVAVQESIQHPADRAQMSTKQFVSHAHREFSTFHSAD